MFIISKLLGCFLGDGAEIDVKQLQKPTKVEETVHRVSMEKFEKPLEKATKLLDWPNVHFGD